MSDLAKLARPFPKAVVHGNPSGGGTYVSHDVVTQWLLGIVGPFTWECAQVIRGDLPAVPPNPKAKSDRYRNGVPALVGVVVGVVGRLTVIVDGRTVIVEEAGDVEDPNNWPHDGARMKDAMSDAIKRCAMRLGLGLHLWSGNEYRLHDLLVRRESGEAPAARDSASGGPSTLSIQNGGDGVVAAAGAHDPADIEAEADRGA